MTAEDLPLILHHGFDAGNYANAYVSTRLKAAWEAEVEDYEDEHDGAEPSLAYRAAFVIGFFSSYENHEVPGGCLEELLDAHAKHGAQMIAVGIAVDDRSVRDDDEADADD